MEKEDKHGTTSKIWKTIDGTELVGTLLSCSIWIGVSFITPSALSIPPENPEFSYPYHAKETIATVWLVFTAFPFIWAIFGLMKFLSKKFPQHFKSFSFWSCVWCHITNVATTNVLTIIIQDYVGRASPDFYTRCGSSATPSSCPNLETSQLNDVLRSFPSSHASTSLSALLFLSLFLRKVIKPDISIISLIAILPVGLAVWIGATRIVDYRRHPSDVVAGYVIALLVTYVLFKGAKKRIFNREDDEDVNQSLSTQPLYENEQNM